MSWPEQFELATVGRVEVGRYDPRRPANSPGSGTLAAVKSGLYVSERDPQERVEIKAGVTRVSPDYWLARERPELFKPVDKRDSRTAARHLDTLERAAQDLERGRPASRTRTATPRRGRVLPPKAPAKPFRLPRAG
jgi:hypothetical protein